MPDFTEPYRTMTDTRTTSKAPFRCNCHGFESSSLGKTSPKPVAARLSAKKGDRDVNFLPNAFFFAHGLGRGVRRLGAPESGPPPHQMAHRIPHPMPHVIRHQMTADTPNFWFPQYKLGEIGAENACLRQSTAGHNHRAA